MPDKVRDRSPKIPQEFVFKLLRDIDSIRAFVEKLGEEKVTSWDDERPKKLTPIVLGSRGSRTRPFKQDGKVHARQTSRGVHEVLAGKRPILHKAIYEVLGDDALSIYDIAQRLRERGWLPKSVNTLRRVGLGVYQHKELFEQVDLGHWRRAKKSRR